MWLASLILNTGSAVSQFLLKNDELEARKNLLQTNYANQVQKLKRDLVNYKESVNQSAASNNIDPTSPLVLAEIDKATTLTNDIENQGASNLSQQLDGMYSNSRFQLGANLFSGFADAGSKAFSDYLTNKRTNNNNNNMG